MGKNKKLNYETEVNDIAEICKALGHPARVQIMALLLERDNRTCGEIVSKLSLVQSTVSKHLLELKKANLLFVTNVGKKTNYTIQLEKLHLLKDFLNHYIISVDIIHGPRENEKNSLTRKVVKRESKLHLRKHNYQFPEKPNNNDPAA